MQLSTRWKKYRTLLISWSFIPTMIILAGVAVLTYLSYQNATNDLVLERNREVTYLSAARLREELTKYTDILTALARTGEISGEDQVAQQVALKNGSRRLSVFDGGVVLLNNLGKVVGTQPYQDVVMGADWSSRPYFSQLLATRAPAFSDTLNDGPQAAKVVSLVVPVTGPAGEFRGALVGMFKLGSTTISPFYASIVRLRVGESGSSFVVDGRGKIIYHSDFTRIGDNVYTSPEVQQVLSGKNSTLQTRDANGKPVVAAFAPVPGTGWGLVTEEDWTSLTASGRRYGQILLVLLALGMVLPALGVAQQIRQRNREALERQKIENELRVAQVIQKTLLPKSAPQVPGWDITAHWQPARAVSGDFYDFIIFPDNKVGLVIGDVTDKGIPAGLVMASTRSILRGVSERLRSPSQVLERVNNILCNNIPHNMFVTCLYAELDMETGQMVYANAGQNLPYRRCDGRVSQIDATGLPLGLLPEMNYEEFETFVQPGELLLFYSDGLVEAHNPSEQMYSNRRLESLLQDRVPDGLPGNELVSLVLSSLKRFTGENWNQEDDVTLMVVRRLPVSEGEKDELERSLESG